MDLTKEEEHIYEGKSGESQRRAMEILVALGDIYEARNLIPIRSVQVAGVSFKNIGDAGLEWISDLKGRVTVPSILNPAGMDLQHWKDMGIDKEFAIKQKKVIDVFIRMGISADCTCIPYQVYSGLAEKNDHLAWSESSAVSYANSVIGARTNREGGPSALAAAIIGKTPNYGYHLDENRMPTHQISVDAELKGSDFGALGFLVGKIVKDGVPRFDLRNRPNHDELKALGAAMAATGSVALYYVESVTSPPPPSVKPDEKLTIDKKEIDEVYELGSGTDADIVAIGCPHCSIAELKRIAEMLRGKKVRKDLWICTARKIAETCPHLVKKIEESGAKVICDTCMVVSPASQRYKRMMTNSGKALVYLPGLCNVEAALGSTYECIQCATEAL